MNILTRQEKRKINRYIEKKRSHWKVPNWKPMQFVENRIDHSDRNSRMDIYKNDIYTAVVRGYGEGMIHISFRNKENSTEIPWRHKQQIKNDICGREREAIEIFPAMSRIVDAANQYHLWVFPENFIIPTGFAAETKKK